MAKESRLPIEPADPSIRPDPSAVVYFYPNPIAIMRAYVESDFATALAQEHERQVAVITGEGAEVTDAASYARVGERLVAVTEHRKAIELWFKPIKDFAYRLHRMVCDRESVILAPLVAFEAAGKANRLRLEREDEARRREEERRLQAEARRLEQERLTRDAAEFEARGEHAIASQVMEQAISTPGPVVTIATALPPTKGVSSRPNYKWRPVGGDTPEARARAVHLVPREFLCLDERKLNAYAKSHGLSGRVPGIEFYDSGSVSVRTV